MPRDVHGGVVGGSGRLVAGSRPVGLFSGVGWPTVRWRRRPLLHVPRVVLRVHAVGLLLLWLLRLDTRHGHVPTLPLAEFHLALVPLPFLPLSIRHEPLLVVFHHADWAFRIVLLRRPQLFPVGVQLGRRPWRLCGARRADARIRLLRARRAGRHRAGAHAPRLSGLLCQGQRGRPLRICLRGAVSRNLGRRAIGGRRRRGGRPRVPALIHTVVFGRLGPSVRGVLGYRRRLRPGRGVQRLAVGRRPGIIRRGGRRVLRRRGGFSSRRRAAQHRRYRHAAPGATRPRQ